jgi:predicted ATPase
LWLQGYPDQAAALRRNSIQHARDVGHEYSLAIACTLNAFGAEFARASEEIDELARQGAGLSEERGFPWYLAWCEILLGRAQVEHGDAAAAIARIRTAMDAFNGAGARILRPWALMALATAQGRAGQSAAVLGTIADALGTASEGEYIHLAEIHRVRGELMLQASGGSEISEAEASFRLAIDYARSRSARSWELRSATSLARLLHKQNRADEAIAALKPIYAWFTEGFDTPDLREAAALLVELGSP